MSKSRSRSGTVTADGTVVRSALSPRSASDENKVTPVESPKNLRSRVSESVIGVKGSLLKDAGRLQEVENPMARLKLLLVRFTCS